MAVETVDDVADLGGIGQGLLPQVAQGVVAVCGILTAVAFAGQLAGTIVAVVDNSYQFL